MTQQPEPSSPQINATVMASAGTGKTWLLVSRLLRLLLNDAQADTILAITFTRKAAAEMQSRLSERLYDLASADDELLHSMLREIHVEPTKEIIGRARSLYESLLQSGKRVRTTTFHAFCQEILRRFPLEADVPPGFELIEGGGEAAREAWEKLLEQLTQEPDSELAQAMEQLLEYCGGLHNLEQALFSFLNHRSDWWAYTEGQSEPQTFAQQSLQQLMQVDEGQSPLDMLLTPELEKQLGRYVDLLNLHQTKGNMERAACLGDARSEHLPPEQRFSQLRIALLTQKDEPRACKPSATQAKKMGAEGQENFIELHQQLSHAVITTLGQIAAADSYESNRAWYLIGCRFLELFQLIKAERRQLDFTDLEWRAYRLLQQTENANWVQYKLDQRIDHLLVDEFQDTNPTQWRLLQPLLEEMAAGNPERQRSIFLVGDAKQSIYRFRRAEPKLFQAAHKWLEHHLGAFGYPLHTSWRSSPAIMQCVNKVFGDDAPMQGLLQDFTTHDTHLQSLWGSVTLMPLIHAQEEQSLPAQEGLRNPLEQPRIIQRDTRYQQEGEAIAQTIQQLISAQTPVGEGEVARPMHYGDIMILVRSRTHVGDYEQALRQAGIPYLGAERGTLLESLEVRDIVALLDLLITPYNNLSLAQVLRSPIFACSDEVLQQLASMDKGHGNWYQRLAAVASDKPEHTLYRAWQLLKRWRDYTGKLPIHDLLDKIYCEADVLARYRSAYPRHLQAQCESNLTSLLELALSVDSGRYPSLGRFLSRLSEMRENPDEAPDEAPAQGAESRVRIMTIHAAKGLEAPVVFLADTARGPRAERPYRTLVDWPAEAARPESLLLVGKQGQLDPITRKAIETEAQAEKRENANLLYVALTRARQHLYISASAPLKGSNYSWYGAIRTALEPLESAEEDEFITLETGQIPTLLESTQYMDEHTTVEIPRALSRPIYDWDNEHEIAPSVMGEGKTNFTSTSPDEDGRLRGTTIHRMLELLTDDNQAERNTILQQVAAEQGLRADSSELTQWLDEAMQLMDEPQLHAVLRPSEAEALNEVAITYQQDGHTVNGVIDRLIIMEDEAWVIDYKTHRQKDKKVLHELAQTYRHQLNYYVQGAKRLWPDKKVKGFILFTHSKQLIETTH